MRDVENTSTIIITGDFNMKSITNLAYNYNICVKEFMQEKYHLHKTLNENTANHSSKLDLCVTNTTLKSPVVLNYRSYERTLSVALKINILNNNKNMLYCIHYFQI